MAEKDADTNQGNNEQIQTPQYGMMVHTQYVKDFSFENPNAPETLNQGEGQPQLDANINMQANVLDAEKHLYEVVLEVSAKAERANKTLFMAEIAYGLMVSVNKDVPEDHRHPLLLVEGPKLAFPYVRQLLSTAIQSGGYPPLLLQPVNFEELYRKQYMEQMKAKATSEAEDATKN